MFTWILCLRKREPLLIDPGEWNFPAEHIRRVNLSLAGLHLYCSKVVRNTGRTGFIGTRFPVVVFDR
jgi:hypothetical protein